MVELAHLQIHVIVQTATLERHVVRQFAKNLVRMVASVLHLMCVIVLMDTSGSSVRNRSVLLSARMVAFVWQRMNAIVHWDTQDSTVKLPFAAIPA